MIRIITGYSGPGGSTFAHINLVNAFNERGYAATLYGPHNWHLGRCSSDLTSNVKIHNDDIVILHFMRNITARPNVKKLVLSLHEKELFPLKSIEYRIYDHIHYLNKEQRKWHDVKHPNFICPNAHDKIKVVNKNVKNVAGIIGNIDRNKQVHVSIERALRDGMKQILIYGNNHDNAYWIESIQPLINKHPNVIKHMGFVDDKCSIYSSVSDVYMSSLSENASYVRDECVMTKTTFHGNEGIVEQPLISNDDVISKWCDVLEI